MSEPTKGLPGNMIVRFEGVRSGVELTGHTNVLSQEGKVDRLQVYRIGRLPDEFAFYLIVADDQEIARLTRGPKQWNAEFLDGAGEMKGKSIRFDRTATKRAKRKAKDGTVVADNRIDGGPDLFLALTKIANEIWPDIKATGGGATRSKLRDQLSSAQKNVLALAEQVAILQGKTIREVNAELGLDLPEEFLAADEAAEEEEEAEE